MKNLSLYKGYQKDFLKSDIVTKIVQLPRLKSEIENEILHYLNFSVCLSKQRKLSIYTASNIDGKLFKNAERASSWKKDKRTQYQWGKELYKTPSSKFDRGHMTKREDVQWGEISTIAQIAADSTFYYPNSIPQHKDLNRKVWKRLENYILHRETRNNNLKICVFTGPVLSENDMYLSSDVKGESVQIPSIFWKVVIFPKSDGKLYRVGFLLSQRKLLVDDGVVNELESYTPEDKLFMEFDDAETYQVNISLIEEITGLSFTEAIDTYIDERSTKLVLDEIEVDPDLESDTLEQYLGYDIPNITL